MASQIEAIEVKRKMYFEHEGAPYHCLDVEISKPTARGGQTLVRLKMRNMITRAVFDKTFKAGDKFHEPDLEVISAAYLYADADGFHFMDQESFETLTISAAHDATQTLPTDAIPQNPHRRQHFARTQVQQISPAIAFAFAQKAFDGMLTLSKLAAWGRLAVDPGDG